MGITCMLHARVCMCACFWNIKKCFYSIPPPPFFFRVDYTRARGPSVGPFAALFYYACHLQYLLSTASMWKAHSLICPPTFFSQSTNDQSLHPAPPPKTRNPHPLLSCWNKFREDESLISSEVINFLEGAWHSQGPLYKKGLSVCQSTLFRLKHFRAQSQWLYWP